jgi:hypothetical protein
MGEGKSEESGAWRSEQSSIIIIIIMAKGLGKGCDPHPS